AAQIDHVRAGRWRSRADGRDAIVVDDDDDVCLNFAGRVDQLARADRFGRCESRRREREQRDQTCPTCLATHDAYLAVASDNCSAISRASVSGEMTRAKGPKLRIQLWSARSR